MQSAVQIRKATSDDLDRMMVIYAKAKEFMDSTGNTTQWKKGYPTREMIAANIAEKEMYVCVDENDVSHAAFLFHIGEDPTYRVIEDGSWKNDHPYGTIHRVASDGIMKGVFAQMVLFCEKLCPELRADTHKDNAVMQHLLEKNGFEKCGIIYVHDGTQRLAYQRVAK